jgi:hypothetical protein
MMLAVTTTQEVLAIIGLVIGLVVLLVVIFLLQSTLAPLRKTLASVELANEAPMLQRGVPGTEQLGQTRRLAESVPPLALAYLQKLGAGGAPAPAAPPPPVFPTPGPSQAPAESQAPSNLPAWKRYQ